MRKSMHPEVDAFCQRIKALGFVVELAESKEYGFITDDSETRVLSFSFNDGTSLSGNYGPPSTKCGTGWRMDRSPWDLTTAEDVRTALRAPIPQWIYRDCRASEKPTLKHSTVAEYRALYQSSSRFSRV